MTIRRCALVAAALVLAIVDLRAQEVGETLFKNLEWRAIGPAVMGGRVDDVAVDERNPSVIFVAAASGGLWKTTNSGTTWEPLFDAQPVSSIGDVALAPSNPDIVWVGTGEPNNRQSSTFGDGVYKSVDGGRTWRHMGLRDTQHIGRIVVDPVDPDVAYVAALGRLWGPNKERGLFKTTDGGATWTNTNFIDEDTGCVDVAIDPANRHVLYAAAYQRRRAPWGFNGGGPGSGIYKTSDGGGTWKKLTRGLPAGVTGRIGLDVYRRNGSVIYATVEHKDGGIFRSDDAGESWRKVNDLNPRPMYYSQIRIDPTNERRIYVLGASFFVSEDGGRTFTDPKTGRPGANTAMTPTYDVGVHGDHHALWIDPANSSHLILGGDGGVYFSFDGSVTWDKVNNIPLAQFYAIGVDMRTPYHVYGGLQDTHSWGGPSATRHYIGITNADWFQIGFGDGMYAQVDPRDPDTVYTEAQDGNLVRFHRPTGDRKVIKPVAPPGGAPHRFNWTAPLQISPHDPNTLYFGGNRLFKSADRGDTWTASRDLTRAEDRDTLSIMGVLPSADVLSRNDGVAAWGTITTLAESPLTAGLIWVGTDDGYVQVTRDGGSTWANVSDRIPGPARKGRISRVESSHHQAGTAYVALDRHQDDDSAPYVYVTLDFGQTWKPLSATLPPVGWVNVIREHQRNPKLLFVGTETGLFVSVDGGAQWVRPAGNFPTVPVDDLLIHPRDNDLVVGTHGRSIYVLDDLSPLEGLTSDVLQAEAHLFAPRPATIMQVWKHESYGAQRQFIGPNPPRGAIINYFLKTSPGADVRITIQDQDGKTVRELTGTKDAGINRVIWDLRCAGPEGVSGGRGPFVLPGQYVVKLAAAGRELTRTLRVDPDPDFPSSDAERQARVTFLLALNELQALVQRASAAAGDAAAQTAALVEQLKKTPGAPEGAVKSVEAVSRQGQALRARLAGGGQGPGGEGGGGFGNNLRARASALFGEIDGGGVQQGTLGGPTPVQQQRLGALAGEVRAAVDEVNDLVTAKLSALNAEMEQRKIPRLVPIVPVRR